MIDTEKRSARYGAAILIFAVLLRLVVGFTTARVEAAASETVQQGSFLPHRPNGGLSVSTGPTQMTTLPVWTTAPTVPPTTMPTVPETQPMVPQKPPGFSFTVADMGNVKLQYGTDCGYRADLQTVLLDHIDWQLNSGEPTVLILHSHATESYTRQPGEAYLETDAYRTTDTAYNMVAVGDILAAQLEAMGIVVIHDRENHDYPSYSAAYGNSRKSVEAYLQQYPSIQVVLDLHRDAALNADGSQYATAATVGGQRSAQIMLVVGTDWLGGNHPNWQENLSLALKLQVLLEQENPGINRRTVLRGSIFNQNLSAGMLIVEVGTAGNTMAEALRAISPLAKAIAALTYGANTL